MSPERPPPKKRRRIVISCTECHRRKQKCDRELPCANCRSRNKEDSCTYDDGAPTAKEQKAKERSPKSQERFHKSVERKENTLSSQVADLGYSQTGPSTMGLLRRIESVGSAGGASQSNQSTGDSHAGNIAIADKYKTLIRQLPSRALTQKLADIYFRHLNWHYSFLEKVIFYEQLDDWNSLPFASLSTPLDLPNELRVFPALLFQVVASALLVLPDVEDLDTKEFESLKYAGGMSWEDLAVELSESGMSMLQLFGKRHLALTTVQAQFLRAAFTKYLAKVADSWHTLAGAIRDAQELGLHHDSFDPKPRDDSIESVLENQWLIQVRRKMYMILSIWDMSCAMILGRPSLIDWGPGLPTRPIDVDVPPNRRNTPLIARDSTKDAPTPVTKVIWLSHMTTLMRDIQLLQEEGPFPKDFSKVDILHERCLGVEDAEPAFLRLENADTRWDSEDRIAWIQDARMYFKQFHNFCLLALHRPYIFHRRKSRDVALRACLDTLHCHQAIFRDLPMMSWRNYLLFFGSFDAIVVVSSIFIMYPHEQVDLRETALQHFRWTITRFETMQSRNGLAKSAIGVLKTVLSKFVNVLEESPASGEPLTVQSSASTTGAVSSATPASTSQDTATTTPASMGDKALMDMIEGPSLRDSISTDKLGESLTNVPQPDASMLPPDNFGFPDPSDPNEWPWMPQLPTVDLVYGDLNVLNEQGVPPESFGDGMTLDPMMMDWRFGGGVAGDDTVWQYLNQYQPGQA